MKETNLVWFRQDLRLSDNPALFAAASRGHVLPIYIFDDCAPRGFKVGAASKLWLERGLQNLNNAMGGRLNFYKGSADAIIKDLIQKYNVSAIFCSSCFEPWHQKQEKQVETLANESGLHFEAFNSNYLWHPESVLKDDGTFYKVFSPYKRKAFETLPRQPMPRPEKLQLVKDEGALPLEKLHLNAAHPWAKRMEPYLKAGEDEALKKLEAFKKHGLDGYKQGRDFPAQKHVSELSAHLHFGEISPHFIWHQIWVKPLSKDREHFLSELTWREFSCYLMHHFPTLHDDNFNPKFNRFPWSDKASFLKAWQKGQTGIPIVDAGMRQLWQTGTMHNRVRMIVASLLTKNLGVHWHHGRDWFWDCLFDADLGNNSASWQWVAGCGADAAPYFRIFNPVTQGQKFDGDGIYIKQFVPELKDVPTKYLFSPWQAPENVLRQAGVTLGSSYPHPIVDLADSRKWALDNYEKCK